jgi:hypothetical protein
LNKYVKQFRLHIQFSIVNGQFPDRSGLTLRCNRLVRVRRFKHDSCKMGPVQGCGEASEPD